MSVQAYCLLGFVIGAALFLWGLFHVDTPGLMTRSINVMVLGGIIIGGCLIAMPI
jgi:hypothetical protein